MGCFEGVVTRKPIVAGRTRTWSGRRRERRITVFKENIGNETLQNDRVRCAVRKYKREVFLEVLPSVFLGLYCSAYEARQSLLSTLREAIERLCGSVRGGGMTTTGSIPKPWVRTDT